MYPIAQIPSTANAKFLRIPRSREVGQSYASAIMSTARASISSISVILRERPDVILVNGPGTCLPVVASAKFLSILHVIPDCRVIFVESVCRTEDLSVTGRLLYTWQIADVILVQWPQLAARCVHAVERRLCQE